MKCEFILVHVISQIFLDFRTKTLGKIKFPILRICSGLHVEHGAGAFNGTKITFFAFTFHSVACDARFFSVNSGGTFQPDSLVYASNY